MEFHESDDSENDEAIFHELRLDVLPPEIILHICSFLSAKFVLGVLSRVCKKFKALIENETIWRMRICRRWPKSYPIVPPIGNLDWKAACIAREEQHRMWSNYSENMRKYHLFGAHFGSVNVVRLIENAKICVSGGRDGFIKLWNLDPAYLADQPFNLSVDYVDIPSCLINSSHHANAWLWDITYDSVNKHVYTGGFDSNIKCWDLNDPVESLKTYSLSSPILCLAYYNHLLATGCFGRVVAVFDIRAEGQAIYRHIQHKKPVLAIASDDKYIISASEDKSIIIYDKIAGKISKRVELGSFPLSMSYAEGQLIIGDVTNSLHVIDPRHGEFRIVHTFPSGHSSKVTGVQNSQGSIITCSTDKTIRVLEPNVDPGAIAVIESTHEVSRLSFCNNILACANVDDSVSVWVPQDIFD